MNDFESQYNSDSCSDPVHIKEPGVISQAVNRKHHAENDDLRNYVGKKDGELAMQFSPKHHPRHRDLQGGVCQPEYVAGELCARAHEEQCAALARLSGAKRIDLSASTSPTIAVL